MIAGEKQISFGKVAAVFWIVGPPIFILFLDLAIKIANRNADTLLAKLHEVLFEVFSFLGFFASYFLGFVPSSIAGFTYSRSRRHQRTIGHRLLVATLIGAAVYFLAYALVMVFLYGGRVETDAWLFTVYAAGAGAVSAFLCALIVEIYLVPSSEE